MSGKPPIVPNPPIKGHELLYEGHSHRRINPATDDYFPDAEGGCRCGARPPGWPHLSVNAVKRWHRGHKIHVRLGLS